MPTGLCQLVISAFFPGRGILIGPHIALALQRVEQWVQGAGFQFKDVVGFAAKSFNHFVAIHIFRFQRRSSRSAMLPCTRFLSIPMVYDLLSVISTIDSLYMKVYIDSLYMSSKGKSVVQYARKIERKTYLFHKNENNTCETVQNRCILCLLKTLPETLP